MPKPKSPERPKSDKSDYKREHKSDRDHKREHERDRDDRDHRREHKREHERDRVDSDHRREHRREHKREHEREHEIDREKISRSREIHDVDVENSPSHTESSRDYPELIRKLIDICLGEATEVKLAFKNRNRQNYKNIFESYKDKLSERDYSIIKGALFYLYEFSRVTSIDKKTAAWMIGIHEIPASQIISYTRMDILKSIAKDHGLSYSNKKAEDLVKSIRGVIDPSQ
jgi:hypothetical protein